MSVNEQTQRLAWPQGCEFGHSGVRKVEIDVKFDVEIKRRHECGAV